MPIQFQGIVQWEPLYPLPGFPQWKLSQTEGAASQIRRVGAPACCWLGVGVLAPTKSLLTLWRGACYFQMDSDTPTSTQSLWHLPVWGLGFWSHSLVGVASGLHALPFPAWVARGPESGWSRDIVRSKFSVFLAASFLVLWLEREAFAVAFFFVCVCWHFWVAGTSAASLGYLTPPKKNPVNLLLCHFSGPGAPLWSAFFSPIFKSY